jgi:hypothetical protein
MLELLIVLGFVLGVVLGLAIYSLTVWLFWRTRRAPWE